MTQSRESLFEQNVCCFAVSTGFFLQARFIRYRRRWRSSRCRTARVSRRGCRSLALQKWHLASGTPSLGCVLLRCRQQNSCETRGHGSARAGVVTLKQRMPKRPRPLERRQRTLSKLLPGTYLKDAPSPPSRQIRRLPRGEASLWRRWQIGQPVENANW